jgi:hypothetical protein
MSLPPPLTLARKAETGAEPSAGVNVKMRSRSDVQVWPGFIVIVHVTDWIVPTTATGSVLIVLFGVLINSVFILLGAPNLVPIAAMAGGLMFSTVFYVSLYFTFSDCFESQAQAESDASMPPTA